MHPAIRWRSQLTTGSAKTAAAGQRPIFLPLEFHAEWDLVTQGHPNFLLVGTPSDTYDMIDAMKPHLREPLHEYTPTAGMWVPQPPSGTLVLLEVAKLDAKQQIQLLRWLDQFQFNEGLPVQVVSTTSEPIFSMVQANAFLADLYYKLNVVRIDLVGIDTGEGTGPNQQSD
jgi:hypothetical protein